MRKAVFTTIRLGGAELSPAALYSAFPGSMTGQEQKSAFVTDAKSRYIDRLDQASAVSHSNER